jgi:hypothetical protein
LLQAKPSAYFQCYKTLQKYSSISCKDDLITSFSSAVLQSELLHDEILEYYVYPICHDDPESLKNLGMPVFTRMKDKI